MNKGNWQCIDLGLSKYSETLVLQQQIVASRIVGDIHDNILLVVEHLPVFTLGNQGGKDNLKVSEAFLEKQNIDLIKTKRGGDITYHGPGQIVLYPIVSLKSTGLSVPEYIWALEEVMINAVSQFAIKASRSSQNHGVWVNDKKIGSVGISIRRGVSYHGLALNVTNDLAPFSWINPCGLQNTETTSLEQEIQVRPSVNKLKSSLIISFKEIFGVKREVDSEELLKACGLADHAMLSRPEASPNISRTVSVI